MPPYTSPHAARTSSFGSADCQPGRKGFGMRSADRMLFTLGFAMVVLSASSVSLVEAGVNVWTGNGPEGGRIPALAIDPLTPSTVYAGTEGGGVFKSIDGGAHWSAGNTGLTDNDVHALAVDPRPRPPCMRGRKAGAEGRSSRAPTAGRVGAPVPPAGPVTSYALAIDPRPQAPSIGLWGNQRWRVQEHRRRGHWSARPIPPATSPHCAGNRPADPEHPLCWTYGMGGGVFKSTDGGGPGAR